MTPLNKSKVVGISAGSAVAIVAVTFIVINAIKLQKAKQTAASGQTNVGTGVTAATSSPKQLLGLWSAMPSLNYVPYAPTGTTFYSVGDYQANDMTHINNVTLDTAYAQIPSGAAGFVFVVTDNQLVTPASVGTVWYKSMIDQLGDSTKTLFRFVGGSTQGSTQVQYLPSYNQSLFTIATRTDTLKQAITITSANQMAAGFSWTPNDSATLASPQDTDIGVFEIKTTITPMTNSDLFAFTYIINPYQIPTHSWTNYKIV